jgi:hypothetical protein
MMTTAIVDFNYNGQTTITEGGVSMTQPKQVKGGTFAPVDIEIIKEALGWYVKNCYGISDVDERNIANLLHRLNRIG